MTETFSYDPDYGAKGSRRPRVNTVQFGDGYQQRFTDGINSKPQVWSLQFMNRDATEAAAIDDFLDARGGIDYFYWTPPDGVQGKYVCSQWEYTPTVGVLKSITATFAEVFDS